jgi:hypothetical protein
LSAAGAAAEPPPVDLVVNCFERSYREVLAPGFFPLIVSHNQFAFARRVALINNVTDPADACRRADELLAADEIDAWRFVADLLPAALARTGLTERDLGKLKHWSDCPLAAITMAGSPWLCYWDADVRLAEPVDWITPTIALMDRDPRLLVGSPAHDMLDLEREAVERVPGFALGYGFSDQCFLARRHALAKPIYGHCCLAGARYPTAHLANIFEQRLDAHMRVNHRLRAVALEAVYVHPPTVDDPYPAVTLAEKLRRRRNQWICRWLRHSRSADPRRRVFW